MTLMFDNGSIRSETSIAMPVPVRVIGFGLLVVGAVATATGVSVMIEHLVTRAAGTLVINALLPFLT